MSETTPSYGSSTEICIDFDRLPAHIGTQRDTRRFFQTNDIPEVVEYMKRCLRGTSGDVAIVLTGYLPPWFWVEAGAFIAGMGNVTYRARNGFTCKLPVASGVL